MEDLSYSSNLMNAPFRIVRGLLVTPWQISTFKHISNNQANISIDDLIASYEIVFKSHGLIPSSKTWIRDRLNTVRLLNGSRLTNGNSINFHAYNESLVWFAKNEECKKYQNQISGVNSSYFKKLSMINEKKYGMVVLTTCIDMVIVCLIMFSNEALPQWLIVSRISAILILTNMAYLLIPLTSIASVIPDRIISQTIYSEYSSSYHKVFGVKILLSCLSHTLGHMMQIRSAISKCKNGCSRKSILIVPASHNQIVISYGYFAKHYAYITGLLLLLIFGSMLLSIGLYQNNLIRYSTNQLIHKYTALLGMIFIILHGCSHLLGFNYSLILLLPFLLMYLWKRKNQVLSFHVRINRWHITQHSIRLYLQDDDKMDKMLDSFGSVSIYVNYPKISKLEWHPFTLSRGYDNQDAILTMKRVGRWTNSLSNILSNNMDSFDNINVGHYTRSKFRFHRLYDVRYFFCSGVGITAFVSAMMDMLRNPLNGNVKTILIWSINSVEIMNEFNEQLVDIKAKISSIEIQIHYSNRLKQSEVVSKMDILRFAYLQSIISGNHNIDILAGAKNVVCCSLQRADISEIMYKAFIKAKNNSTLNIGVFVCGSKAYAKTVLREAKKINSNQFGVEFRVWHESI